MRRSCAASRTRSKCSDPSPREFRDLVQQLVQQARHRVPRRRRRAPAHEALRRSRPPACAICHPRDLLLQVKAFCEFHDLPLVLTTKALDVAVKNYFAGL